MDPLQIITYLSIILTLGLFLGIISRKLNIPDVLLLILLGIFFGNFKLQGEYIIQFPGLFTATIALVAMVFIIFEGSLGLNLKKVDELWTI